MNIQTKRLRLQEITWEDLEDIHWLHSFPEVDEFNTLGIPENLEVTRKVMQSTINDQKAEKRREIQWSIRLIEENTFIGLATLGKTVVLMFLIAL